MAILSKGTPLAPIYSGRHAFFALRGRGNRYYSFRNVNRLRSLKIFRALFGLINILSTIAVIIGLFILTIWLILGLVFALILLENWKKVYNIGLSALLIGGVIFVLSMILRMIIERIYFIAERKELKKFPDGSEKYLTIMRASTKVDIINLCIWLVIIGLGALCYFLPSNALIGIALTSALILLIISRIMFANIFNKVSPQIEEVQAERRQNKTRIT